MKKTLIERIEVTESGGRAAIEFTVIPQTYTDLYLVCSLRSDRATANDVVSLSFNGNTSNFSARYIEGSGSSAGSYADQARIAGVSSTANQTASVFGNSVITITNYTASSAKSWSVDSVNENNATSAYQIIAAGLWNNSAPISSIKLDPAGANLMQYSSASLYGVTAGNDGTTTVS